MPIPASNRHLDASRQQIVDYYLPSVVAAPPDALLGQLMTVTPTIEDAKRWLKFELGRVFPKAETLIQEMKLDERYKDVTFETLNRDDFLDSVKEAFPNVDWEKAYQEFKAAGQSEKDAAPKQLRGIAATALDPNGYNFSCPRQLTIPNPALGWLGKKGLASDAI